MFNLSLTQRYIPAIVMLVIFIISSHFVVGKIVNDNKELAKIINISGKQRMLSQRLIILGQNYYENPFEKSKTIFVKALNEIKTAHKYLITKNITKKLDEIYFGENGLDKHLKQYLKHFDNLLVLSNPIFLKTAREDSAAILKQLDSVVKEYERYSTNQVKITSQYEFYILLITLMILVLEVLFIFRPAAKKIEEHTKKLIDNTKELLKNKEYEETVIESNNTAIIAIDWTGKITTYNQKAQEMFGWTKQEMIGTRNLLNIIPPKYKKLHQNASAKYLNTGKSCGALGKSHQLEGLRKDGTIFNIKISFGAKYKIKGAIVVANIIDITKEIEQNNLMIQQSKMASMGEMMENIAHQWRQPLSAITTAASGIIVEKEYGILKDSVMLERLESIMDKSNFLSDTINDFSNFFKQSKKREVFLISDVLIKTQNIIKDTYKLNNIKLYKNYDSNIIISCLGYSNELSQVILNILNNAKDILIDKKTLKDKIVKIELTQEQNINENDFDDIIIRIYDNAGGISDDILPKIFEPYFTTKHKSQGTGIGLYMSSDIINNHFNGCLTASNENFIVDDKKYFGACFQIRIPTNMN